MLEQCKLGFVYDTVNEDTYVTVGSLANYLQVMAVEVRLNERMPDQFAEVFDKLAESIEESAKDFKQRVTDVTD